MKNLGVIIFDMDGTLVDSLEQHADVFSKIMNETYGISPSMSSQEYLNTSGQPLDEQIDHVLRLARVISTKNKEDVLAKFWVLVGELQPVLFPEVEITIQQLVEAGYILVVISAALPSLVKIKLQKTGIDKYVYLMLGTDKNIPDMVKGGGHFKLIRQSLGFSQMQMQAESVLVGDTPHDMKLGKKAGMLTIGRANWGNDTELKKAGANIVIRDISELVALFKNKDEKSLIWNSISTFKKKLLSQY